MVHILCKLEEDAVLLWLRACVCENEWSQRQCRIRGKTVRNVRNSEKKCSVSHTHELNRLLCPSLGIKTSSDITHTFIRQEGVMKAYTKFGVNIK